MRLPARRAARTRGQALVEGSRSPIARRGQALVEFALVAPVFFLVVIMFVQLAIMSFDNQVLMRASRAGTSAANAAMLSVNERFARDGRLTTPGVSGVPASVFGSAACRRAYLNDFPQNLGWDWGCFSGSRTAIEAPLRAAIDAAAADLDAAYLGPWRSRTVTACYAVVLSNGNLGCRLALERTDTLGANGNVARGAIRVVSRSASTPATVVDSAPSFVEVTTRVTAMELFVANVVLDKVNREPLDRFLPSCAPDRTLPANPVLPGSCTSLW